MSTEIKIPEIVDPVEMRRGVAQKCFLEELARSGNVARACEVADIARKTAYAWRNADAEFREAWAERLEAAIDNLEEEAYRRAFAGTEEPIFYQGKQVGKAQRFSDVLAIFMLKSRRRAVYGDQTRITHSFDMSKLTDDELEQLEPTLMKLIGSGG